MRGFGERVQDSVVNKLVWSISWKTATRLNFLRRSDGITYILRSNKLYILSILMLM